MIQSDGDRPRTQPARYRRRGVLKLFGGALGAPFGIGATAYSLDRSYRDADGDGIPDSIEQSAAVDAWLTELFGADQFEGLDADRRDLLLDVRYVGETTIADKTKATIVDLFRENGIYLQWLEYPERYSRDWFEQEYGYNAKQILWSPRSFYHQTIERRLKNISFQLLVVPGLPDGPYHRKLYSPWTAFDGSESGGYVNGFNTGNRAVVTARRTHESAAKLILHEIAHYAVCHATDPANTGVMGTKEELDLMDDEWEALRSGLGAIRDTTGVDVMFRRCLWSGLRPSKFRLPEQLETGVDCAGCRTE